MISRILLFSAVLAMITQTGQSQDMVEATATPEPSKHAVGAGLGLTTGYGLLYRFTPNRFGIQATIFPKVDASDPEIQGGVTFLYKFRDYENIDFYLYQGNSMRYDDNEYLRRTGQAPLHKINNGLGFGAEVLLLKHVGLSIMTGIAAYDSFTHYSMTGEGGIYLKL